MSKPFKSKTKISDLLDMVHMTLVKKKKGTVILKHLQAIDEKIKSGELEDFEVDTPFYWTAIFKDIKDNGYNITEKK